MTVDYIPYTDWQRNYAAMKDDKLVAVLDEFEVAENDGILTAAVEVVMENGGDIEDNHERAKRVAQERGILAYG